MTERRGGLGRGLAALIPTGPATPPPAATETATPAEKAVREDKGWFAANGAAGQQVAGGEVMRRGVPRDPGQLGQAEP